MSSNDLLDEVNSAFAKRNVIVHNALVQHPDTGEVLSFRETARGSLRVSLQPLSAEDIQADAIALRSGNGSHEVHGEPRNRP